MILFYDLLRLLADYCIFTVVIILEKSLSFEVRGEIYYTRNILKSCTN